MIDIVFPCYFVRNSLVRGLIALLFAAAPAAAVAPAHLRLVDDRGKPLASAVEVCFRLETRSDCAQAAAAAQMVTPQGFVSVRVEGDDYGPVVVRRQDLSVQSDGSFRIAVARKALLTIERPARQPGRKESATPIAEQALGVSLYLPDDPSFREPMFRATLGAERRTKVPSGVFIVSLTEGTNAPDLQRLTAQPGATVRLAHRQLQGWSLVVRCHRGDGGRPVSGAEVRLAEALGFGRPEQPIQTMASAADGIALFSGVNASLVTLSASHAGLLPADVRGISAGPGTFALRDVALTVGGRLVAQVSVHGRPLPGAGCEIDAVAVAAPDPHDASRQIWKGTTDAKGVCRSQRLPAGGYRLRVRIPDSSSTVRRWITLAEDQDLDEDLALAPSRVSGVVKRRDQPAPGYVVTAASRPLAEPSGAGLEVSAGATSDEAGKYELTLWEPGQYILRLRSPAGGSVAGHQILTTLGDDDQTADFTLDASAFTGSVVDELGQPMAGAIVTLVYWDGGVRSAADAGGSFEIDVQGEGSATLRAGKPGYGVSDEMHFQVAQDAAIPPATLVVKRRASIRGTVVSAAGEPLPDVRVTSLIASPNGVQAYGSAASGPDGTFEVTVPPGAPQLFVDGATCPLSLTVLATSDGAGDTGDAGDDTAPANVVRCPAQPAALELTFVDDKGRPVPHAVVLLRLGGVVVPQSLLAMHQALLGLPAESDGAGRLVLADLAPNEADLFLKGLSSEGAIAAGLERGFLTSVNLPALQTTEVQLTLPSHQ